MGRNEDGRDGSWWGVQVVILYAQVVGSNIIVVFRVSSSRHHRYSLLPT